MKVALALVFVGLLAVAAATEEEEFSLLKRLLLKALKKEANTKRSQGNGGAFSQMKKKTIVNIAASGEAPEERNIDSGDATETESKKMGVPSSGKDVEPAKQDRPSMGPSNKPANQDRPSVGRKEGGRPHMPKFDDEDGEMVAIPHPEDHRRGPPSIPLPVLAFVMGSRAFTAAPLDPADLSHGVEVFGETLKRVVSSLRQVASDVRQATSLANILGKLQSDISSLGKTFIPAQRMATASFTRVMLYGLTNRVVCDLDAEDVDSCVEGRLALLATIFEKPDHMDKEVDQMKRCTAFVSKFPNGDAMDVSEDIDCVADRVMKIMEFVDKMKQTTAEAQLTSLLNARPLPKLPMDMDRVENEVTMELTEEFRGIIGMGFKILHEVGNLVETL